MFFMMNIIVDFFEARAKKHIIKFSLTELQSNFSHEIFSFDDSENKIAFISLKMLKQFYFNDCVRFKYLRIQEF